MKSKESLMLINSFFYSFVVAFSDLEYIFLVPIFIILFFEKEFIFDIFKKLIFLNFFILVLVIFVSFHEPKEALELFIRTNLILLFNISLFYKSKGYDLVRGLDSLNFPSKIVSVLYFSLSLIEYLTKDFKETKNTLKSRGFISYTSIFTYQTYGNIFAMIFIKALRKSEDMKLSMNARGFENKIFFLQGDKAKTLENILFFCLCVILLKVVYELFR